MYKVELEASWLACKHNMTQIICVSDTISAAVSPQNDLFEFSTADSLLSSWLPLVMVDLWLFSSSSVSRSTVETGSTECFSWTLLVLASQKKQKNNEITFADGGVEERLGLRSVRSVSSEQVPAGGGGGSGSGGGGAELHPSIVFPSSSCRLHQVREQSDPLLKELQHLTVLLLDVS